MERGGGGGGGGGGGEGVKWARCQLQVYQFNHCHVLWTENMVAYRRFYSGLGKEHLVISNKQQESFI